jgi:hypothetical protein
MSNSPSLPYSERAKIVMSGAIAGLALYLAASDLHIRSHPIVWVVWHTLTLGLLSLVALSQRSDNKLRYAGVFVCATAGLSLVAIWAGWSIHPATVINYRAVLLPYALSLSGAWFVLLPYLQAYIERGEWRPSYSTLFECAWQNVLTLLFAAAFVGVCWLILVLAAELFEMIGLPIVSQVLGYRAFDYLATGLMAGLGLLFGRILRPIALWVRRVAVVASHALLPFVAFVGLMFVLVLPLTGLAGLWHTGRATTLLLSMQILMVLLLNAVYQDGTGSVAYPAWLRWLVGTGLLSLPIYAALALYALHLRIGQYGWTAERVYMVALTGVLAGFGVAYAVAGWPGRHRWLHGITRANISLAVCGVGLVAMLHSPVLDPFRIGAISQSGRWRDAASKLSSADDATTAAMEQSLQYLRFDSGRRGYLALQGLRDDPAIAGNPALVKRVADEVAAPDRWSRPTPELPTLAELREHIELAQGAVPPSDDYLLALQAGTLKFPGDMSWAGCTSQKLKCILLTLDLHGDGQRQNLLCDTSGYSETSEVVCKLATRSAGQWVEIGEVNWSDTDQQQVRQALRAGQLIPRQPAWPELEVAGKRARLY